MMARTRSYQYRTITIVMSAECQYLSKISISGFYRITIAIKARCHYLSKNSRWIFYIEARFPGIGKMLGLSPLTWLEFSSCLFDHSCIKFFLRSAALVYDISEIYSYTGHLFTKKCFIFIYQKFVMMGSHFLGSKSGFDSSPGAQGNMPLDFAVGP